MPWSSACTNGTAFCVKDAGTLTVARPWQMLPGRAGDQASLGSPSHSRASAGRGAFNMKPVALAASRPCKPQRRTGYSRQERHSSAEPVMAASSSWRGSMPANGDRRSAVSGRDGEAPSLQRGLQRAGPRGSGTIEAGDCSTQLLPAVPWQRAALRQKSSHSSHSRDPPPHHSSTSKISGKDTTNFLYDPSTALNLMAHFAGTKGFKLEGRPALIA